MKASHPKMLATKLLERLASGSHGDALAGDLIEQYQQGRSGVWYWRQVLFAIVVYVAKDRTLGGPAVLGSLLGRTCCKPGISPKMGTSPHHEPR